MPQSSILGSTEIDSTLKDLRGDGHSGHAWIGYQRLVCDLARHWDQPRMLEVGGGRAPLLAEADVLGLGCHYTVNDIDVAELDMAPSWVDRLLGDIADPHLGSAETDGQYDVIFSKMVFEHVEKPKEAYANIFRLLSPGGIVVNFVPTLYSLPFVLNRALPERAAGMVLRAAFPYRNHEGIPKFPAYYRWCSSTMATRDKLKSIGFSKCEIVPFYGHNYYQKIPMLRWAQKSTWRLAERRSWRTWSSYAFIVAER